MLNSEARFSIVFNTVIQLGDLHDYSLNIIRRLFVQGKSRTAALLSFDPLARDYLDSRS